MTVDTATAIEKFQAALADLYGLIEAALQDHSEFGIDYADVQLNEEVLGSYDAKSARILVDGKVIAQVVPVGANVIGASGRADVIGPLGSVVAVLLSERGPVIRTETRVSDSESVAVTERGMFKGVTGAGWYFFDRRSPATVTKVDAQSISSVLIEIGANDDAS